MCKDCKIFTIEGHENYEKLLCTSHDEVHKSEVESPPECVDVGLFNLKVNEVLNLGQ